ncbi:hypothetical protein [Streptomyces sp. NPDC056723]|uniref:hypothetical protein n=1 Tax=Streptomyces sp. NPDC056723 TaxID=3345925 RepID=UPI003677DEC4
MGHNVVPSILASLGGLTAAMIGAPWWCIVLIAALALAAGVVQTMFPQASEDKLEWWINRREYLGRRYLLRSMRRMRRRSG